MMKKLVIFLFLILAGCSNNHEHQWIAANYQQPAICSICQQTVGEPLIADFEKYNIQTNMKIDSVNHFPVICNNETQDQLDCTAEISRYEIIEKDDKHPYKEGYVWVFVDITLKEEEPLASEYGFIYNYLITDYYSIKNFNANYHYDEKTNLNSFEINNYGKNYQCDMNIHIEKTEWYKHQDNYQKSIIISWELSIPKNYDGIVIGVRNGKIDSSNYDFLYEYYNPQDFVLFRVNYEK